MLGGNSIYAIIRTHFEWGRTNSYVEQVIIAIAIFAVCLVLGSARLDVLGSSWCTYTLRESAQLFQ